MRVSFRHCFSGWVAAFGLVAGCATPSLSPSASLEQDARLAALPAGLTVVGGAELSALQAVPALAGRVQKRDAFGVPGGLAGVRALSVGCAEAGCVGLAEGEMDGLRVPARMQRRAHGRAVALGEGKALVGQRRAVTELQRRWAEGGQGLHQPAWLDGLVPEGELWLAARSAPEAVAQAQGWLADVPDVRARAASEALDALLPQLQDADASVEALALALSVSRGELVLRVRARTEGDARWLATLARGRLLTARLPDGLSGGRVVREGRLVEVVADVSVEVLAAQLDGASGGEALP